MSAKTNTNILQAALEVACKGTTVTPRELIKELSKDELLEIKSGDLTVADLRNLVTEMADDKDNIEQYRINVKNSDYNNSPGNIF